MYIYTHIYIADMLTKNKMAYREHNWAEPRRAPHKRIGWWISLENIPYTCNRKFSQVQFFAKIMLIFIFTVFIFTSAQIIIDHTNLKIHWFKILQFLPSRNQHGCEERKNLHHPKIFRYTVYLFLYIYIIIYICIDCPTFQSQVPLHYA